MNELVFVALASFIGSVIGGLVGAVLVDAKFWWSFVQDVYYHQPGNHPCKRVGCCQ